MLKRCDGPSDRPRHKDQHEWRKGREIDRHRGRRPEIVGSRRRTGPFVRGERVTHDARSLFARLETGSLHAQP